jgi:vitamin B12 transporter
VLLCSFAVFDGAFSAISAQEVLALDTEKLPPVVVEGATVEKPKVKVKPSTGAAASAVAVPGPPDSTEAASLVTDASPGEAGQTVTGVPANQIGSAVTVVTGAQLKAQQIRNAADALRSLPGVHVNQGGSGGGLIQVRIRGAEANHTLVIIDGIDASSATGNEFDWSNLLSEDIDRIEVIRGGQSGIYGSKAIGGVINIITKGGKGPLTLAAKTEFGSYGTRDVSARAQGGTDQFWLAVSAGYREQDGFNWDIWGTEDDPWEHSTFNVKGGMTLMPGLTLDFFVRSSSKLVNSDPELYGPRPETPHNSVADAPDYSEADVFLGGLNLRWDMLGGALTHLVKANRNDTDTFFFASGMFGGESTNDSLADTFSYLGTYRFSTPELLQTTHSISAFIEKKDEEFTPGYSYTDTLTRERSHVATVGEYRTGFYDRFFVGGTIRHDDNDTFDDFTTWNANASLNLPEIGLRPHASTGTNVALPGMFEQFGLVLGNFIGNPNLVPEESYSWDVGVEFTTWQGRAILDVTYFQADLKNEIYGSGDTMQNDLGVSERKGVEISGRLSVTPGLTLGASYTYLDATNPDGSPEVRRPEHSGRGDLNYSFDAGRGNFNLAAIYNGRMDDSNFAFPYGNVLLDEYWLVNAAASYQLTPQLEVFGRVDNLLDERYEEVLGYNTMGIAAYAGARIKLEDPSTAAWAKHR